MVNSRMNLWIRGKTVLLAVSAMIIVASMVAAQDFVVDQQSADFPFMLHYNVFSHDPMGQEFTPSLDHVDVVEFHTGSSVGTRLQLLIHNDTIDGEVLGSAMKTVEDTSSGVVRFELDESVSLVPLGRYVIEVRTLDEIGTIAISGEDPYPNGRLIVTGEIWDSWDAWFREGVWAPTPIEATSWGAIKLLYR